MKQYCVYILSNGAKNLYIGSTSNLPQRLDEHRNHIYPKSFTAAYNLDKLVFAEVFDSSLDMIAFERKIKGWTRAKKLELILKHNPSWSDIHPG
jgi:putative endonuclease